jgi:chorismate dehydratase
MKDNKTDALRVGAVPFVNGRPLVCYIDPALPPPIHLTLEVPSRLTEMMQKDLLDAALLPSVEYFRAGDYKIIPGIAISADGAVESVKIFSRVPISEIRSLALDEGSRTSAALARILLKRKLGSPPRLANCASDATLDDVDTDSMLLIGDAAMVFRSNGPVFVLDLGEEWKKLTGLPFVYAIWAVRTGVEAAGLTMKLRNARDAGMARLDEIAVRAGEDTGLDPKTCLNYLRYVMMYELGEREIEALRLFQRFAVEDGLCPKEVEIAFESQ